jgi:hypothetical protein
MVLAFAPAEFFVAFFGARTAYGDVLLASGYIGSNWNRAVANLPKSLSRLCRPRTVFDKFRLEIAEPEVFRFDDMNVGVDHSKTMFSH